MSFKKLYLIPKYVFSQYFVPLDHFQQLFLPLQSLNLTEVHYRQQRQRICVWERVEKEKKTQTEP